MNREIRASAALVGGAGLVFMVENLFLIGQQGWSIIFLPLALLVLDVLAATLIINGNRALRTGVLMIIVIGVLVDIVILFGAVPAWLRVVTGLIGVAQIVALVLLNRRSVRAHFDPAETDMAET